VIQLTSKINQNTCPTKMMISQYVYYRSSPSLHFKLDERKVNGKVE